MLSCPSCPVQLQTELNESFGPYGTGDPDNMELQVLSRILHKRTPSKVPPSCLRHPRCRKLRGQPRPNALRDKPDAVSRTYCRSISGVIRRIPWGTWKQDAFHVSSLALSAERGVYLILVSV